jgi:hypothetical protein
MLIGEGTILYVSAASDRGGRLTVKGRNCYMWIRSKLIEEGSVCVCVCVCV